MVAKQPRWACGSPAGAGRITHAARGSRLLASRVGVTTAAQMHQSRDCAERELRARARAPTGSSSVILLLPPPPWKTNDDGKKILERRADAESERNRVTNLTRALGKRHQPQIGRPRVQAKRAKSRPPAGERDRCALAFTTIKPVEFCGKWARICGKSATPAVNQASWSV